MNDIFWSYGLNHFFWSLRLTGFHQFGGSAIITNNCFTPPFSVLWLDHQLQAGPSSRRSFSSSAAECQRSGCWPPYPRLFLPSQDTFEVLSIQLPWGKYVGWHDSISPQSPEIRHSQGTENTTVMNILARIGPLKDQHIKIQINSN